VKKKIDLWLESFIQWGIFSRSDILSGKITRADMIKAISQISAQKKESRLVINLPEWLKKMLAEKAKADNMSMNQVIRIALIDYLTKDE
jgi:predicted HicB family RNase H-like nuclease